MQQSPPASRWAGGDCTKTEQDLLGEALATKTRLPRRSCIIGDDEISPAGNHRSGLESHSRCQSLVSLKRSTVPLCHCAGVCPPGRRYHRERGGGWRRRTSLSRYSHRKRSRSQRYSGCSAEGVPSSSCSLSLRSQKIWRSTKKTVPPTTRPSPIHWAVAKSPMVQGSGRKNSTIKRPRP